LGATGEDFSGEEQGDAAALRVVEEGRADAEGVGGKGEGAIAATDTAFGVTGGIPPNFLDRAAKRAASKDIVKE